MEISVQPTLSVAPMMDWTDRHCRYFLRLLTKHTQLYTEMVTTAALLHADPGPLLRFDSKEHPVALQLGGSEPEELAKCALLGAQAGYDEINLNIGCPSDRVQSGRFGACLMAEPELVADCVAAMRGAVQIPVTVKTRLGIDHQDSYELLAQFTEYLSKAGASRIIVHARKAWLQGLSPKQNREVPPLDYQRVYRLKEDFPTTNIHINGGVKSLDQAVAHLRHVDGVMLGREAYHNPYILADADQRLFGEQYPVLRRHEVIKGLLPYVEQQLEEGIRLHQITRHILGLYHGVPGARAWRRTLSECARDPSAGTEVIDKALAEVAVNDREVRVSNAATG